MVESRSRFLGRGHYGPLAERLTETFGDPAASAMAAPLEVLDSGCGEGYFLAHLRRALEARGTAARLRGVDVSRPAIRAAARRDPALFLAVASVHRLPVLTSSLDVLLRVLAPVDASEFRRVLRPGGRLLSVTPGPQHLFALREIVYERPAAREAESAPNGFTLVREETLSFPIHLSRSRDALDLLAMTPYYWHASEEARERLRRLEDLETTADFRIAVYAQR